MNKIITDFSNALYIFIISLIISLIIFGAYTVIYDFFYIITNDDFISIYFTFVSFVNIFVD